MKAKLLERLVCPGCYNGFKLKEFTKHKEDIEAGVLRCEVCQNIYPVIRGIPRIIKKELISRLVTDYDKFRDKYKDEFPESNGTIEVKDKHTIKIAQGFKFEWSKHSAVLPEHEKELLDVFGALIKPGDFSGKVVLDAGCGQGRFSRFVASYGVKEIVCIDFSEAVLIAKENLKDVSNAHIVQADIMHLPFKNIFDLVYSIGVIHHLPCPQKGFNCLLEKLQPKGQIFFWVYGYSSVIPVLKFLRLVSLKVNIQIMWFLSIFPAILLYAINQIYLLFKKIKITEKLSQYIPFHMYAERGFHNIWTVCFDHLTTSIAYYFRENELQCWFKHDKIKSGRISGRYAGKSGSSWRVLVQKG